MHTGALGAALASPEWGVALSRAYAAGEVAHDEVSHRIQLASTTAWALMEICDRYPVTPEGRVAETPYYADGVREVRALWIPEGLAQALAEAGPAARTDGAHWRDLVARTRRELVLLELAPGGCGGEAPAAVLVFDVRWRMHDPAAGALPRADAGNATPGIGLVGVWTAAGRERYELTYALWTEPGTTLPAAAADEPEVLRLHPKRGGYASPRDAREQGGRRAQWLLRFARSGMVDGACRWHELGTAAPTGEAPPGAHRRSRGAKRDNPAHDAGPGAPLFQVWRLPAPPGPPPGEGTPGGAGNAANRTRAGAAHTVRGHWRWQPCGTGRERRKLVWVRAHWRNRGRGLLGEILIPSTEAPRKAHEAQTAR